MTTINNPPQEKSPIIRNTLIAGGIGAGISAGSAAIQQKTLLSNKEVADEFIAAAKSGKMPEAYSKEMLAVIENQKISYSLIGKSALGGGVIFAGIYLAYKGIKSLFNKNEDAD